MKCRFVNSEPSIKMTFSVPESDYEWLSKTADRHGATVQGFIRTIVRKARLAEKEAEA